MTGPRSFREAFFVIATRQHIILSKFRSRLQEANQECARMRKELKDSMAERRALEEQNTKRDKRIHEMAARLKQSDENARKQVDQVTENGNGIAFHVISLHFISLKMTLFYCIVLNRPFQSCVEPRHESEAKCKGFIMKTGVQSSAKKTNLYLVSLS